MLRSTALDAPSTDVPNVSGEVPSTVLMLCSLGHRPLEGSLEGRLLALPRRLPTLSVMLMLNKCGIRSLRARLERCEIRGRLCGCMRCLGHQSVVLVL